MKIDFSKGIEYWKDIINQFVSMLNDLWMALTGSPLFNNETPSYDDGTGYGDNVPELPTLHD